MLPLGEEQVVTGSCNWETRAFDSNSENIVVIEHNDVGRMYECIFEAIRGRPPVHMPHNHADSLIRVRNFSFEVFRFFFFESLLCRFTIQELGDGVSIELFVAKSTKQNSVLTLQCLF